MKTQVMQQFSYQCQRKSGNFIATLVPTNIFMTFKKEVISESWLLHGGKKAKSFKINFVMFAFQNKCKFPPELMWNETYKRVGTRLHMR